MLALQYRPSIARYLATKAGAPSAGGALALEDIKPPAPPAPDWIPVKPRLSGICGSDQALLSGEALPDFIQPRVQHAAIRRIRAHRRRGDRVILITGALDFLVESLTHLGDELVAARLVERTGRFTGELAEPPLTADGRASLAARLAAEHDVELADCHAYGDSLADLPLLELVGHPHAINPDFRLAREARRRRWAVEEWTTERAAV